MKDEHLREWVDSKVDEGIDPEKIKDVLRRRDQDPSIVDEVRSDEEDKDEASAVSDGLSKSDSTDESEDGQENIEIGEYAESLEQVAFNLEKGFENHLKQFSVIFLTLIVLVGAGLTLPELIDSNKPEPEINQTPSQQNTENISGIKQEVILEGRQPEPPRAEISEGNRLRFENNLGFKVKVEFDSFNSSLSIEQGESENRVFTETSYYTVKSPETERTLKGSVYVK